jgi:hypothetical protein
MVDVSLINIVKEVNTLAEFENERAVFQVCLNVVLQCKYITLMS